MQKTGHLISFFTFLAAVVFLLASARAQTSADVYNTSRCVGRLFVGAYLRQEMILLISSEVHAKSIGIVSLA